MTALASFYTRTLSRQEYQTILSKARLALREKRDTGVDGAVIWASTKRVTPIDDYAWCGGTQRAMKFHLGQWALLKSLTEPDIAGRYLEKKRRLFSSE